MDLGTAFEFIDRICGQEPDGPEGPPVGAEISGAYNSETGDFMIWEEYKKTVGKNGNPHYRRATGPWRTFAGSCSLVPESTWAENDNLCTGEWVHNSQTTGRIRDAISRLEYPVSPRKLRCAAHGIHGAKMAI